MGTMPVGNLRDPIMPGPESFSGLELRNHCINAYTNELLRCAVLVRQPGRNSPNPMLCLISCAPCALHFISLGDLFSNSLTTLEIDQ
ncbi:hypothetical protein SAMN02745148_01826 [Modicisalibacter ilicicola DSM 19980]|uniref:Uncharacterized protein n=1 Tax=Modicisalibacter ilicicola DSM 19980 TaxID=1121942 RepID=A0A1M4Z1K7_9GAMM|nr:hypothetical protein SAMN02745148_01826 [Halomonas ilicicola DSM 19980]